MQIKFTGFAVVDISTNQNEKVELKAILLD